MGVILYGRDMWAMLVFCISHTIASKQICQFTVGLRFYTGRWVATTLICDCVYFLSLLLGG